MAEAPRIESSDLSLSDVFKDFYSVPDFQREYVWEQENVQRLLQDVLDEFQEEGGRLSTDGEYFIGSIVACKDDEGTFQLIDGQQRMTTGYLVLCVIRDYLRVLKAEPSETLKMQIAAPSMDPRTGKDVFRHRVTLQYEDSRDVLETIADGKVPVDAIPESTESVRHVLEAYEAIWEFLDANFTKEPARVTAFLAAFTLRVKLIRVVTPNLAHALKVFETINDRGVGLDAMDLLKNLLFMKTSREDYPKLKDRWKILISILESCSEKPLRFLRYYIMSHFDTDSPKGFREEEIYPWFTKHSKEAGIEDAPLAFVDGLIRRAKAYSSYVQGKDARGDPVPFLQNIALLSGAARQHFILLLAAEELAPEIFLELCRNIENLFFCYVITREPTKTFERNFARWSKDLRGVRSLSDLDTFLASYITPDLQSRSEAFDFAFQQLNSSRIQRYRLRYILAKLTQDVEQRAWTNPAHTQLEQYMNKSVDIEHILPQEPTPEVRLAFDKPDEYEAYSEKLGNLTLLEKTINTSVSNGPYSAKRHGYHQSAFLLTKSLDEKPHVGSNTKLNRAVQDLLQFEYWNSQSIEQRQAMLGHLARRVWLADIEVGREVN